MMSRSLVAVTIGIHLSCLGLTLISSYPGGFFVMVFSSTIFFTIGIMLVALTIVGWRYLHRQQESQRLKLVVNSIVAISLVSILTSFPRNIVFMFTAPAFETDFTTLEKDCKEDHLGLYLISDCFAGKNGGLYFVTGHFFYTDYGFAYRDDPTRIMTLSLLNQPTYYPIIGNWELFEDSH
jgi:vacuolar-type H+-ATPase subunit I/STV1